MTATLQIAEGFEVDATEYASRANAILGIRDSGKTYTATLIAEQLYRNWIPFFALDPIGRWRFLRSPGKGPLAEGFPVVVIGGANPDIEAKPQEYMALVRAAMSCGVSMVIDLYDVKLGKKDLRAIVRETVEVILYENESIGGGLRHVFLEEAAEFVPQRVYDGMTYAAVEKLVRMGGNAGVGVTLINQRAEEVNKAVLELCDNLLLHRQRGKNSLLSLRKWLEAGNVTPPKEITDSLADLPTGECWAWFKDVGKPRLIKVAQKLSFDPNRRELAKHAARPRVDVSGFITSMRLALEGKKAGAPMDIKRKRPKRQEDPDVKESEAKALRAENEQLKRSVFELEERLRDALPKFAAQMEGYERQPQTTSTALDLDAIYEGVKTRAMQDPKMLAVLRTVPEIEVTVSRKKIEASGDTLTGRVAILLSEGFFDQTTTGNSVFGELKRRGASVSPAPASTARVINSPSKASSRRRRTGIRVFPV